MPNPPQHRQNPIVGSLGLAGLLAVLPAGALADDVEHLTSAAIPRSAPWTWGGEFRPFLDGVSRNGQGPLAESGRLAPGLATRPSSAAVLDVELRGQWQPAATPALSLHANILGRSRREQGGTTSSSARSNELYFSDDLGAWQLSAGKKIVGWDVGYGFRPNDVVQQEVRRTLLTVTPEGRPLFQAEHFDADTSTALVWVHPLRVNASDEAQRWAQESALAARWYRRAGTADTYVFARLGRHTGASTGAALAWVATDALELHASARVLQRHDGWATSATEAVAAGTTPAHNPWTVATQGPATQLLLGAQWTGEARQSVIVEAWHDGTALAARDWRDWTARTAALSSSASRAGLPEAARTGLGGQLAWQATPLEGPGLHRDNVFVRLAWQPEPWQFTLDALLTPTDEGHMVTAGLQWQGDRVRVNAAWRIQGGPHDALLRQLPQRRQAVLAATVAF